MGSSGTEASVTCKGVLAPQDCSETGDASYIYPPPAPIPLFNSEVNMYLTSYALEGCGTEKDLRYQDIIIHMNLAIVIITTSR